MGSTQSYPRSEYWSLLRGWLVSNARTVAVVAGIFLATVVVEVLLLIALPSHEVVRYLIASLLAATAVGFCWMVHVVFLAHEGQAINQLRGSWGEDNTSDELKTARRRNLIWQSIDSVGLEKGDIDHFVITRRGGVVVVDSKWASAIDDRRLTQFAESARTAANKGVTLLNTVSDRSRGRHSGPRERLRVTPVVVVWGAAQRAIGDDAVVEGVHIVRGRRFSAWLADLEGEPISEELAGELAARVEAFDERRRNLARAAQDTEGATTR